MQHNGAERDHHIAGGYRGIDRRHVDTIDVAGRETWWWAIGGVGAVAVALALGAATSRTPVLVSEALQVVVRTISLVVLLGVAGLALTHHRATGLALGRRLAITVGVLSAAAVLALLATVVDPDVLPPALTSDLARTAVTGAAGVSLSWAVSGPIVDARPLWRHGLTIGTAVIVLIVTTALLPVPVVLVITGTGLDHLAAAAIWLAAVAMGWRYVRRRPEALAHATVCAAPMIAGAEMIRLLGEHGAALPLLTAPLLRTASVVVLATGAALGLARSARSHRSLLHASSVRHRAVSDAGLARRRRHAHEIRNALMGIDAATTMLQRTGDDLEPSERERLSDAVASGISHLRNLLDGPALADAGTRAREDRDDDGRSSTDHSPVTDVTAVVRDTVALARARPLLIATDLRPVHARVCPTGLRQIIDNLLINVERHVGVNRRVRVQVRPAGDVAEVIVDDDGPGLRTAQRTGALAAGVRFGPERSGEGLGLAVVSQVVADAGGTIALGDAPGGGLRVTIRLIAADAPSARRSSSGSGADDRTDTRDDGGEIDEFIRRAAAIADQASSPGAR
ncbi:MAG: HAMP domain-containing histidine kinase [Nitriliruptoraceae bacterium]|nr:HAMP domain-containing histidine kinase [Nitriliruptoraceae bacterium]